MLGFFIFRILPTNLSEYLCISLTITHTMTPNTQQLNDLTIQVRRDILRMVHAVNSGHPGGSLGCAEFLVTLYHEIMTRKEGFDMNGIDEDLFFLSNGHISPVFYSVLARSGYFRAADTAYITTEAAVARFRLSALPEIGIATCLAPRVETTFASRPLASLPKIHIAERSFDLFAASNSSSPPFASVA